MNQKNVVNKIWPLWNIFQQNKFLSGQCYLKNCWKAYIPFPKKNYNALFH